MYFREDQAMIGVSIANENGTFVPFGASDWYSVEGGNLENDDSHVRPALQGLDKSLGGPSSREDLTVTRPLDDTVVTWHKTFEARVQTDAPTKVSVQYQDRFHQGTGQVFNFAGTLKSAFLPDMDTGSSDAAMYTLIVSCDEAMA
jgi:hypothetical protein